MLEAASALPTATAQVVNAYLTFRSGNMVDALEIRGDDGPKRPVNAQGILEP